MSDLWERTKNAKPDSEAEQYWNANKAKLLAAFVEQVRQVNEAHSLLASGDDDIYRAFLEVREATGYSFDQLDSMPDKEYLKILRAILRKRGSSSERTNRDRISITELAKYWDVSERTILRRVDEGLLNRWHQHPIKKNGKYFYRDELPNDLPARKKQA